eukprot:4444753-Amphidinium_carterae.1
MQLNKNWRCSSRTCSRLKQRTLACAARAWGVTPAHTGVAGTGHGDQFSGAGLEGWRRLSSRCDPSTCKRKRVVLKAILNQGKSCKTLCLVLHRPRSPYFNGFVADSERNEESTRTGKDDRGGAVGLRAH